MTAPVVTVIDTYTDELEALKEMRKAAERIRKRRGTKRYGVFVEQRAGTFYLCLVDRGA